ncbi:unnamed protein product [Ranitomeya imitator]|uniref:Transposase n=1 Tax=Ranitomeya imitator TaxID=111125 RepID=A0ABN9LBN3_9NEOB|nr:unnamed protein product [Ranitomeya imitator]
MAVVGESFRLVSMLTWIKVNLTSDLCPCVYHIELGGKKTKELSEDLRNQIVRKHEQSQGYKSISKDLNVPVSTVRSVIKKFKAHGTVANLPRCGRKRKIDKRFQRKIVRRVYKEPRLTSKQVQAALQSEGTTVSTRTIHQRLNEMVGDPGMYGRRPRKTPLLTPRHKKARLEFAKTYLTSHVMFYFTAAMAKDSLSEAGFHFDELNKLRILDPDVSQQTTELKEECREFVEKIGDFQKIVGGLIELVDQLAKETESEKMKCSQSSSHLLKAFSRTHRSQAIGARNLLKSIAKQREAQQQQLQALIAEKKMQLERYRIEYEALCKVEAEQNEFIDQFILQK